MKNLTIIAEIAPMGRGRPSAERRPPCPLETYLLRRTTESATRFCAPLRVMGRVPAE